VNKRCNNNKWASWGQLPEPRIIFPTRLRQQRRRHNSFPCNSDGIADGGGGSCTWCWHTPMKNTRKRTKNAGIDKNARRPCCTRHEEAGFARGCSRSIRTGLRLTLWQRPSFYWIFSESQNLSSSLPISYCRV
jgi:hypothetical protein